MKYKKSDIKTFNWVQLDKMPYNTSKLTIRQWLDRIVEDAKNQLAKPAHKRYLSASHLKKVIKINSTSKWYKVVGTRDGLKYRDCMGLTSTFYVKWVTNVAKSKAETREV